MKLLPLVRNLTFAASLCLAAVAPAQAQTKNPSPQRPYVLVPAGKGGKLSDAALNQVLRDVKKQEPNPEHIVVMMHGFWNTSEDSNKSYTTIAQRVRDQFGQRKVRAAILGLQWESAVAGSEWPWEIEGAYLSMLARGRGVGRVTGRQLMLQLQKSYPKATYHILAHSQGCEVAGATVFPEMDYKDDIPKTEPLHPKQDLRIGLLCLAGSDLDYDVWYKSQVDVRNRVRLFWMTVSSYIGDRDRTLYYRKASRGLGGGLAVPRMTEKQYDALFPQKRLVFDNADIPQGHEFAKYYEEKRVGQLVTSAIALANPRAPKSAQQAELDKVMALPNQVKALQPMLDSPNLGSVMLALWRIEKLLCGGSQHMTDGSLEDVTRLLRTTPKVVWEVQGTTKCQSIKQGIWPTEKLMERAGAPSWSRPKP